MNIWEQRIMAVHDEPTFLEFLRQLREDWEQRGTDPDNYDDWTVENIGQYLETMIWWGGGDFVEGQHGGDPILRRVATMLYVGRTKQR